MSTNTYIAQLIFRILYDGMKDEQYEEQWRLIMADDERAALRAAQETGKTDEAVFADRHGRIVQWQLIAVKDIQPVTLTHGSLLASVIKELSPVTSPLWQDDTTEPLTIA